MATTVMSASNNSTVKKWEKKTWVQAYQQSAFGMIAQGGCIYDASADFRNDNGRGDNITFDYVGKLTKVPLGEGSVGFGNEEALDIGNHNMSIGLTRVLVSNPNNRSIEQQRTNVNFNETSANLMAGRSAELIDTAVFNQLAGFNPTSFTANGTTYANVADKLQVQGHNTPVEPSALRQIRAGGAANDESLAAGDKMTLDLLDDAFVKITANEQPIKPCGDGYYKVFLHPYQIRDLRRDSSGKIQWYQNELAKVQGGKDSYLNIMIDDKPILMGSYLNMKIYQAPRVPQGVNSANQAVITTVRRGVLVGRDALSFASPFGGLGMDSKSTPFKMYVQLSDYDYVKGMDLSSIYGIRKMTPSNAEDIGSFVISTYAAE